MAEDLKKMYRTIMDDHFLPQMEIGFVDKEQLLALRWQGLFIETTLLDFTATLYHWILK